MKLKRITGPQRVSIGALSTELNVPFEISDSEGIGLLNNVLIRFIKLTGEGENPVEVKGIEEPEWEPKIPVIVRKSKRKIKED